MPSHTTVRVEGGLIPPDLLEEIVGGDAPWQMAKQPACTRGSKEVVRRNYKGILVAYCDFATLDTGESQAPKAV